MTTLMKKSVAEKEVRLSGRGDDGDVRWLLRGRLEGWRGTKREESDRSLALTWRGLQYYRRNILWQTAYSDIETFILPTDDICSAAGAWAWLAMSAWRLCDSMP
jgi:hypothetical protein